MESAKQVYTNITNSEGLTWKNAVDVITLGISVAGMGMAGASIAKSGKSLKAMYKGETAVSNVATSNATKGVSAAAESASDSYALLEERAGFKASLSAEERAACDLAGLQMNSGRSGRTSNTPFTFEEALSKLEQSGLRPGQTVISRSRVMEIVESYDPIKASSSVYTDSTGRYLVEGHHTTVATAMLGRGSGLNMNTSTQQLPSAMNIHWTKKWYEFWKKSIKVLE